MTDTKKTEAPKPTQLPLGPAPRTVPVTTTTTRRTGFAGYGSSPSRATNWTAEDQEEDDAWWAEHDRRRGASTAHKPSLWEGTGRGAAGIGSYLGWNATRWNSSGFGEDVWELTEALRFADSMARIVSDKIAGTSWQVEGEKRAFTSQAQTGIRLDPSPVQDAAKSGRITPAEARTAAAGDAIHEAGHANHTPPNLYLEAEELLKRRAPGARGDADKKLMQAATALVEDTFTEAATLAEYPGYRDYLDDHWRAVKAEADALIDLQLIERLPDGPHVQAKLLEIIQDQGRRHTPPNAEQQGVLGRIRQPERATIEAGRRILERAKDPGLSVAGRLDRAHELYKLLKTGEIPPEDQPDLGEKGHQPTPEEGATTAAKVDQLTDGEGRLDGPRMGSESTLEQEGAEQVDSAINKDARREVTEIRTPSGVVEVKVGFVDLPPDPDRSRRAEQRVARYIPPLAQKLRFRAVSPQRHIGAQLRGRLEDARLTEFPISMATGRQPRAFTRTEIVSAPKVGVGLLVDMSGSMGTSMQSAEFGRLTRDQAAQMAAAMLDGALRRLRRETMGGVDHAIFGHTTPGYVDGDHILGDVDAVVYRIVTPRTPGTERIGGIDAHGGNADGPALAATAAWCAKQWPDRERVIFFINDGLPNTHGYGGGPAYDEIAAHCQHLRKHGTEVMTIYLGAGGVGYGNNGQIPHAALEKMYGPLGRGYVVCEDLGDLPHIVGKALAKVLKWQG